MMLCALRNILRKEGFEDLAQGIHNRIERRDINNKAQFVLQSETSYPYLQEHIQKFGPPEVEPDVGQEEADLKNAYEFINESIQSAVNAIHTDRSISKEKAKTKIHDKLLDIRDRILQLKLIFIELDDEDDAYFIFETLNTRGKDLRVSDLVKNHLTKLLKPKNANVDLTKENWNKTVDLIEQSDETLSMDSFLHHLWLSQYEYITAKKLFKAIKRQVNRNNAKQFLEALITDARIYREIHETSFRKWTRQEIKIKQSIDALNIFRVKQDLPMIISAMREYREKKLKNKHVQKILTAIENFHFMFTAITSQRSSGGISLMYASHARELHTAQTLENKLEVINELIKKLRNKRPSYPEFEANFLEILYSKKYTKHKNLVRYILEKIDQSHRQRGVSIDYNQMTIEHIASQNPHTQNAMSDNLIAQIGNLILVNENLNNKLANKEFNEKKSILLNSGVWLDDVLRNASSWGQQQIESRSKALAKLAYDKVWRI